MAVYTLALEGGNYYVGFSDDVETRVAQHWLGRGAMWTRLHPPVRVEAVVPGDRSLENPTTVALMCKVGWHRVRGGSYVALDLKMPRPISRAFGIRPPQPLPDVYELRGHIVALRAKGEGFRATVSGPWAAGGEAGLEEFLAPTIDDARAKAEEWLTRKGNGLEGGEGTGREESED